MSETLLPRREVERRVGLGRSAIYARMARGTFPKPVHDTETETVWWVESEINAWVQARIDASRKRAA
ncbi:helix-turn-helix transcriptional regulator [Rhodanobacter hydrolyticus]|uniref:AlpA family phage regulatory protein n=1 Tax=Rhodanobacter hydrolyticus TaxID=2250595 RepID=A0ABW8J5A2_9GAMM